MRHSPRMYGPAALVVLLLAGCGVQAPPNPVTSASPTSSPAPVVQPSRPKPAVDANCAELAPVDFGLTEVPPGDTFPERLDRATSAQASVVSCEWANGITFASLRLAPADPASYNSRVSDYAGWPVLEENTMGERSAIACHVDCVFDVYNSEVWLQGGMSGVLLGDPATVIENVSRWLHAVVDRVDAAATDPQPWQPQGDAHPGWGPCGDQMTADFVAIVGRDSLVGFGSAGDGLSQLIAERSRWSTCDLMDESTGEGWSISFTPGAAWAFEDLLDHPPQAADGSIVEVELAPLGEALAFCTDGGCSVAAAYRDGLLVLNQPGTVEALQPYVTDVVALIDAQS